MFNSGDFLLSYTLEIKILYSNFIDFANQHITTPTRTNEGSFRIEG